MSIKRVYECLQALVQNILNIFSDNNIMILECSRTLFNMFWMMVTRPSLC